MATVRHRIAGTCLSLGNDVFTVGKDGNFSTLKTALDYIATLPMMDEVSIGSVTMAITAKTNLATFSADVRNTIRPGDLLYLDNDKNPVWAAFATYEEHYYPVLRVGGQGATDYDVVLACGLIGNTKAAGYAPKVYRPRKYTLILESDYHLIDENDKPKIPDGCDITITTLGTASMYQADIPGSLGAEGAMDIQRYGYTTIRNLWSDGSTILTTGSDINFFPYLDEGLCFLTMSNIQMNSDWSFGNGMSLGALVANDVVIHSSFDHSFIPAADYTVVDGWSVYVKESTDIMSIGAYLSRPTTHRKKCRNINCERDIVTRNGADYCIEVRASYGDVNGDSFVDIQNMNILDRRSDADAIGCRVNTPAGGGGTSYVNVVGGTIDNLGATYKGHIETQANTVLRLRDVKDRQGNQCTVSAANAGTIEFLDDDGQQDIAYAASITPNFNIGCKIFVAQLAGNITVNALTGDFVKGKQATFIFESDGSARTITWNAVYKVHTNPNSTANLKAIYRFEYDGSHWIQVNTTIWI